MARVCILWPFFLILALDKQCLVDPQAMDAPFGTGAHVQLVAVFFAWNEAESNRFNQNRATRKPLCGGTAVRIPRGLTPREGVGKLVLGRTRSKISRLVWRRHEFTKEGDVFPPASLVSRESLRGGKRIDEPDELRE
jgi:hypothetical protein